MDTAQRPSLDDLFVKTRPKAAIGAGARPALDDLFVKATKAPQKNTRLSLPPAIKENPVYEFIEGRGKQAEDEILGLFEGATGGIPRGLLKKATGYELPQGNGLARVVGAVLGPGKVASMAAKALPVIKGVSTAAKVARVAAPALTEGAVVSALAPQEDALDIAKRAKGALTGGVTNVGITAGFKAAKPFFGKAARQQMTNVLRPGGKLKDKSGEIVETALQEGNVGNLEQMLDTAVSQARKGTSAADLMIAMNAGKKVDPKTIFSKINELARRADFEQDPVLRQKVINLKGVFEKRFKVPVFKEFETGQFVMGGQSRGVKPSISVVKGKRAAELSEPTEFIPDRGEYAREILTPKKVVDSPDDIVALSQPGFGVSPRKITTVSPQESVSVRSPTLGVSRKELRQVGNEYRPVTIGEAQSLKRAQYRNLSRKGDWNPTEKMAADRAARQDYARGLRESIEDVLPEIRPINDRIRRNLDLAEAVKSRLPVELRQDALSLTDSILAGQSLASSNLTPLTLAALRKTMKLAPIQSRAAKSMYDFSRSGDRAGALRLAYLASLNQD